MKLLHISNIVSPHQIPLARQFVKLLGAENYRFAATVSSLPERSKMGWDQTVQATWILRVSESKGDRQEYLKWWSEADVVLCGDVGSREKGVSLMSMRLKKGKLTFYTSERWWKPPLGMFRFIHPGFLETALRFRRLVRFKEFHYLPIGRYAAADMERWASFKGRSWLSGYYTDIPLNAPIITKRVAALEVLWAGRMLGWKRVDTIIRAFHVLWNQDKSVRLTIIGDGPKRQELIDLTSQLGLDLAVKFQSSLPLEMVIQRMKAAHIYVLSSNGGEGWGAVINEAMTQGCAVVASESAGSSGTMIRHGVNGLLFNSGDWVKLGELLCQLHADDSYRLQLALAAQRTIYDCWSPSVAADRLIKVAAALLDHASPPIFSGGPMTSCGTNK